MRKAELEVYVQITIKSRMDVTYDPGWEPLEGAVEEQLKSLIKDVNYALDHWSEVSDWDYDYKIIWEEEKEKEE